MPQQYLEAGKIINTFGIRGEVKLEPWCDSADFLRRIKTLYIDGEARKVLSAKVHKGMLLVLFEGVEDVNHAMTLKNKIVYFDRADVRLHASGVAIEQGDRLRAIASIRRYTDENDYARYMAAQGIVAVRDKPFLSIEDLKNRAKVSSAVIELLRAAGALEGLKDTNQVTLTELMGDWGADDGQTSLL